MDAEEIRFVGSYPTFQLIPDSGLTEFAFIGRSNVGKSSLINFLAQRTGLARISKQPGKTQDLNVYHWQDQFALVDLPGYGYAKRSKKMRNAWQKMIRNYLKFSPKLGVVFCLIDISISPQKIDIEFLNWLGEERIPFEIIFTKSDKIKPHKIEEQKANFEETLSTYWEWLPPRYIVSVREKKGREEILERIEQVVSQINENR